MIKYGKIKIQFVDFINILNKMCLSVDKFICLFCMYVVERQVESWVDWPNHSERAMNTSESALSNLTFSTLTLYKNT